MRLRRRPALLVAALALGLAAPAALGAPAAAPKIDGSVTESYIVPTRDGGIYLEVVHPTAAGKVVKAPAILTYSPYSVLGRNGDADTWVPQGYARMYADVVGTGNSGGCYDYGGAREQRTGHDVVEWVAKQSWSTGRVGMLGGSYDGTTQLATAITKPRGLVTIVPQVAISQWYGYAYSGGIRYTLTNEELGHQGPFAVTDEGFDTPFAFDFGFAVPPPVDVDDPSWGERVASTVTPCDELLHTEKGYSLTPDYDEFWDERDYRPELRSVTIPALVSGNWGDWNVKQEESWFAYQALLTRSKGTRMYMGPRWEGHGTPPGEHYDKTVEQWFAHYLKGQRNGIDRALPPVTSLPSDSEDSFEKYTAVDPKKVRTVELVAGASADGFTLGTAPGKAGDPAEWSMSGTSTESRNASGTAGDVVAFTSAPLARDLRIFGSPTLRLWSTTAKEWITVTPSLFDVGPDGSAGPVALTRGWLDTRYRQGLDKQVAGKPGVSERSDIVLKPTDYVVRKGHQLRLVITSENAEWSVVKAAGGTVRVDYEKGQTRLLLPVLPTR